MRRFVHVGENVPAAKEHPTQGAVALRKLVGAAFVGCAAVAGAIDKVATARPVTSIEAAFMAYLPNFPGRRLPSWSESICPVSKRAPLEIIPVVKEPVA